ncbi:hypothetical protein L208DRAFT_1417992 [Tricholoma matsutake]|nr:hypothetical protein L208DRAFT_1417992 [Tricholoma matsutake 945]
MVLKCVEDIPMRTRQPAMANLSLKDALLLCEKYPELSFTQVQQFMTLASKLKDDILLAQPASIVASGPPEVLPPIVAAFLKNSCRVSAICVQECWAALRMPIWTDNIESSVEESFAVHGHSFGLCV